MKKIFLKKKLKTVQKIILCLNVMIISLNTYLYYLLNNLYLKTDIFKISDYFIMILNTKPYKDISKYLTNKFHIIFPTSKTLIFKKEIRIKCIGLFNKANHINWLKSKLGDEFILEFVEDNPDYLIYNVFNNVDVFNKYNNSIKIAIYTENEMPDFNIGDYIIGHYHIIYLDRYFKYSIFLWTNYKAINKMRKDILKKPIRKKFCAAVISNCGLAYTKFRLNFINKLSKYKKVDMGGNCMNNINRKVKNKIEFLSNYKFSIAMENSDGDGYISEKITHSFLAGTIPIYFGDYLLDEYFNPKSYILIKGEKDIEKKIEYIKQLDQDDNLYYEILKEKAIIDDNLYKIDDIEIKSYLRHIFRQNKNKAFRRDDNYYYDTDNFPFLFRNLKFLVLLILLLN